MIENYKLFHGDCLELFSKIEDDSIDMILTDLPYGTTQCIWDNIIPFEPMWEECNRVCKETTAILLFGVEPFSSNLRMSNISNFKYDWIWEKDKCTNHLNAKKQPMRKTEIISCFYNKYGKYFPILSQKNPKNIRPETKKRNQVDLYGKMDKESIRNIPIDKTYPNNILKFNGCFGIKGQSFHPTQKPVPLLEYLIKTYTKENEVVLDFTMGSGSTGVASINLNRRFIGIEKDEKYFQIAKERIEKADKQMIQYQNMSQYL